MIKLLIPTTLLAIAGGIAAASALAGGPVEEFEEFVPIVEINATDGDIGFHVLIDGEGWKRMEMFDPDGHRILNAKAKGDLKKQGITEFFMESAEPPCFFDGDDPEADEDEVFTDADFVERFKAGTYTAKGRTIDGVKLFSEAELTHNLPAAPKIDDKTGVIFSGGELTITWALGDDLGECEFTDGIIPDPGGVAVVRWEVVVEPDEDELPEGVVFGVLSVQFPAGTLSLKIPAEYLDAYAALGVSKFKVEVGAREASGNQTFTELEFSIED